MVLLVWVVLHLITWSKGLWGILAPHYILQEGFGLSSSPGLQKELGGIYSHPKQVVADEIVAITGIAAQAHQLTA